VTKNGRVDEVLKKRGMGEWDQLLVEVARGGLTLGTVARDLMPEGEYEPRGEAPGGLANLLQRLSRRAPSVSPVLISGEGGLLVQFAKCCAPLPGEPVVGFITRGRGITVHKAECTQLETMDEDRRVPVQWDEGSEARHSGSIEIHTVDRPGMLADITKLCELKQVNISSAQARSATDDRANISLEVSVRDVAQLTDLIRGIQRIRGVESVRRVRG
jgi:GTP pyrophosphokinase